MTTEDTQQIEFTYEEAVVMFDAALMLNVEAIRTLEDNDDLIAPLKREAEATARNCEIISGKISERFDFEPEDY